MPVIKVPLQHKFGIISQRQRTELQKRIYVSNSSASNNVNTTARDNPYEVSEGFVQEYNSANIEQRDVLHQRAEKMLLRAKRRCGLATDGEGRHVSLVHGWSELAVLAQCTGKIQQDCFAILIFSLNQAPLSDEHVPTLFFLAESVMYWLQAEEIKKNFLRSSEIKLTKIGELVFTRLLYHHFAGNLQGLAECKLRLHTYMNGLKKHKNLYKSYPGVLLAINFMNEAGTLIVGPYTSPETVEDDSDVVMDEVPSIAACIYRSLQVWKHVGCKDKTDLKEAIIFMFLASHELSSQKWLDAYVTVSILGEAAKRDLFVCDLYQDLARGVTVEEPPNGVENSPRYSRVMNPSTRGQMEESSPDPSIAAPSPAPSGRISSKHRSERSSPTSPVGKRVKVRTLSPYPHLDESTYVLYGVAGWSWKVGYQYARTLLEICLHGATADIQKTAMLGKWGNADVTSFRAGKANFCTDSCGLVDLLEFRAADVQENKQDTWKIRYAALYGLSMLTRYLEGNKQKQGLRAGAWSLINDVQNCPSTEREVSDALTISKIDILMSTNSKGLDGRQSNLWMRIAKSLSQIYSLPTPAADYYGKEIEADYTKSKKPTQDVRITPHKNLAPPPARVRRPTIRQEILVHSGLGEARRMDSASRGVLNLNRLVVDQLRKDIAGYQEIDKQSVIVAMERKRKEEETRQKAIQMKRKSKLEGKGTAGWNAYQTK